MQDFSLFPSAQWCDAIPEQCALMWEKGEADPLSFLPEQFSWRQWQRLVCQMATFLQSKGVAAQQLVAYRGQHRLLGLLCYCGVLSLNARILMLNPAMPPAQRNQILADNRIEHCLCEADFADFSLELPACSLPLPALDQPATLTLTSGSSGKPKAVVHSIRQHLASAEGVCQFMQFGQGDSWLFSLPLFHVSGQGIVWRWLSQGATLVICEEKNRLWHWLAQVSHASLVPTQLQRYLTHLTDRTAHQHILLGGAFIPPALIRQAQANGITTYAGYGMTEMASTVCAVKNDHDNVGYPLADRAVKIVDNEIWVRGAMLGLGYWQHGEIVPFTNAAGWFATKDKGEYRANGKLVINGRLDNMFISGGENIQPEAVEATLFASGLLKNIVIVPLADREFGERPVALVEFNEPFSTQAVEKLRQFAKQQLEAFKQPIHYLPWAAEKWQTNGIKISRSQLKQYVAELIREQHNV
ncbi:o-succinylbenzoate--CoA ligase [Muribacter muris]|uniref:O-succinylbenzoate--CoA ligase n=1 Tax=Muribacter muris TaxID=67855 RepID=A0A4Y9K2D1_9PAST|nr:o-succinylbenzoate--CoA ligase [Muribacter muris]MBF0784885.1 o-succinylbenzoate--CoA ligase [Muribacter muris]MBF0826504.1 o-succinylbenzoate--CoA ligase [Muribacter muris]TFV10957.1 o-succinylbenzoate--CoA ligase [Muribacter muris]